MPVLFNKTEVVAKSIETVFGFLKEPSNMVHIMPDITSSEIIGDNPIGVGTRIKETRKIMRKEVTAEVEVSVYDPPHRFGVKSESMGISAEYLYTFTPAGEGTRVDLEAVIQARGIGKILVPLFRSSMKKQDSEQLRHLKAFLEGDA